MKRSAVLVVLVPDELTTVTCTLPVPAGEMAVMLLAEFTVTPVAGIVPKFTAVTPLRLVPAIVTVVPPAAGPLAGVTAVTTEVEVDAPIV